MARSRRSSGPPSWCRWRPATTTPTADRGDRARAQGSAQGDRRARGSDEADFDNVDVARELVKVLRDAKITDPARLQPVYERITAVDPYDGEAHAALGRLAMQRSDSDTAVKAFHAVVALKPVDQAGAYTDLAESYLKAGRRAEAREASARGAGDRAQLSTRTGSAAGHSRGKMAGGPPKAVNRSAVSAAARFRVSSSSSLRAVIPAGAARGRAAVRRRGQRFAGLQWRFVRIKYHYHAEGTTIRRSSTVSRGTSTRRPPSRTCRAA